MAIERERFRRVEDKVDNLQENLYKVKNDVSLLHNKMDSHMELVKSHVSGDARIIKEVAPLINNYSKFEKILSDYNYREVQKEKRVDFIKKWTLKATLASSVLSVLYGIYKFFI